MTVKVITGLDLANQQIKNLADGSAATDAATVQQLQAYVRGLNWKASARVVSTANITLTAPGATINGVTMVIGDRFLAKDQTTGSENGIYVWNGAAAAATRGQDADSAQELTGAAIYVTEGTVNGDTMWVQRIDPVVVNTTSLSFTQFGGAAAPYTAGAGLSLLSNVFAVVPGLGILADGTSTRIDPSIVARKYSALCAATTNPQTFTHNLGNQYPVVSVIEVSTLAQVLADITYTDANNLSVNFGSAPTSGQYRVSLVG